LRLLYVYLMGNRFSTLHARVSNDIGRRVHEHRHHLAPGSTSRYNIDRLVYLESTTEIRSAIIREKQIKGWLRAKKIAPTEASNPGWRDLSEDWQDLSPRTGEDPSLRSG